LSLALRRIAKLLFKHNLDSADIVSVSGQKPVCDSSLEAFDAMVAAAAPTVWAVTGATRGMGLEFCTQVASPMQKFRPLQSRDIPKPVLCVLQILSLHNTKVVAGARPGEIADDLQALSKKYEGRVMIVEMELLDKESVKVGHCKPAPGRVPVLTTDSFLNFRCLNCRQLFKGSKRLMLEEWTISSTMLVS